jgi:hypothetical protein
MIIEIQDYVINIEPLLFIVTEKTRVRDRPMPR